MVSDDFKWFLMVSSGTLMISNGALMVSDDGILMAANDF